VAEEMMYRAHAVDDFEKVRTKMVRSLGYHRRLLADALEALDDDRPHITKEYVQRVVDMLDQDTDYLRKAALS
jgi:hypothetical protein